jgi:putative oxidoreductase
MHSPLARFVEPSYAIMRMVVGFLFAFHGAQKLFGIVGGVVQPIASQRGLAGMIELGGGVLVMIGLLAGLAAFLSSGLMAFAYFLVHAPRGGWPIENDGELAVVFCFVFLLIAARGAGVWSLDAALFRRRRPMHTAPADGWSQA